MRTWWQGLPRRRRVVMAVELSVGALAVAGALVLFRLKIPVGEVSACHVALNFLMKQQMTNSPAIYPNVEGDSRASLRFLEPWAGTLKMEKYGYVPGLQTNDPQNLVLFYLKKPTRYQWHGDIPPVWWSLRRTPRWMIIPPTWHLQVEDPWSDLRINLEGGYLADEEEFRAALRRTLEYLEAHDRPYWRVAAEAHRAVLAGESR